MRAAAVCLLVLSLFCPPSFAMQATGTRPKPLEYQTTVLPNGLRLITHEDHSTPVINVQLWYHVGSKDERPGRTGFAHLFEHLMFKGSAQVEPEEHSKIISNVGGQSNAYTTDDVTVYYQTFPANYLEKVLWLEAERMVSLDVSDENFQQEREVVKEERLTRVENPPYGDIWELLYKNAFDVHPYKHITIGSMEDLNAATTADIREFYKTYYVPNNATLVIAGDFKHDDVVSLVQKYFGDIPRGTAALPRNTLKEPAHTAERRIDITKPVPLVAYVAGYGVPEDGHPDAYPLSIASTILSQGRSSRIYQNLVYDTQLAIQAEASGNFTEDPNLFIVILILNQGASAKEAEEALQAELTKIMTTPVTDEELAKARSTVRSQYTFGRQSVEDKASALGHGAVVHGDIATANTEYDLFMKVTKEDILRVAKQYFRPENRTVIVITPGQGEN